MSTTAKQPFELLTFENEVFKSYLFWSAILVFKMIAMSLLTGLQRMLKNSFINPEDLFFKNQKLQENEYVERARRAHRNDMENIYLVFAIGFLYVLTNPGASVAINLFRVVGIARIIHTIVYAVIVIPQPARGLAFWVALVPTIYMTLQVLIYGF